MKLIQHAIIWVSIWAILSVALLALSEYADYRLTESATSAHDHADARSLVSSFVGRRWQTLLETTDYKC
jgi:hypothetical protein